MANKENLDALDTIHYVLNDPNKLSGVQKKAIKNYFNNTATDTSEQNSDGFLKRSARTFLMNFQPDTFNNSYVNRAYIDAGIDPTIVNTLLKNPSAIDTMKIPDYEKKYLRNLLNIPLNLNTDSINLAKNTYTPGDPTSFIKNSYAKYLKSTNKPDTLKLSDNSTGSGDIGVFDTPDNYTPITPNNSMLPHTAIDMRNHFKQFMPITDTNTGMDTSKNPLGDSVKKEVNQNAKKDTGRVDTKYTPYTPVEIPGFNAAEHIKNNPEFAIPKQEFSNNTGSTSQPTKTPLTESQSDYYRYLTGYRRMDPNQAILSMGLDPNKYYYQQDPAYYH